MSSCAAESSHRIRTLIAVEANILVGFLTYTRSPDASTHLLDAERPCAVQNKSRVTSKSSCRHLLLIARAPPNGRSAMILLQQPTATWPDDFNSRSLLKGLDILLAGSCSVRSCRCAPLPTVLHDEVANRLGELKVASICCLRGRKGNQNVR